MSQDLKTALIRLGSVNPELREDIRQVLAELERESADKVEIHVNTALDRATEATDALNKRISPWKDIAPRGTLRASEAMQSKLKEAERLLREAQKLAKNSDKEIKTLAKGARRSL